MIDEHDELMSCYFIYVIVKRSGGKRGWCEN